MSGVTLESAGVQVLATNGPSVNKPALLTPQNKKKDPNDPSTTSLAYDVMAPRWAKIDTLLGGTEAMRAAGETFLPRHPEESYPAYQNRLAVATLLNMTELTLESWTSKPFKDRVNKSDDMPEQFQDYMEDVDLQGNNIDVFARQWFRDGLAKSLSHVLVEFPRKKLREDGQPNTLADDRKQNLRPYFVHIPPENVIFAASEVVHGVETLTHVRIMEHETVVEGFAESIRTTIKVLEPGLVRIYEERKTRNKKVQWVLVDEYTYDLDFIPLVTFYANREGFMVGKPPLTDLADLNISHWQSNSDQRVILTTARFPILALSGGQPEGNALTVGPNQWLFCPDAQGRYYYVEHQGKAIEAGRNDLRDLEDQMSAYGADALRKKPGNPTATAKAIDSAETTSPLQDMAIRFMDALNIALWYMGLWMNTEETGQLIIETDFGAGNDPTADVKALETARKNRDISRKTYLSELQRREVLSDNFELEDDAVELENESAAILAEASLDLDPEGSDDDDEEPADDPVNEPTE